MMNAPGHVLGRLRHRPRTRLLAFAFGAVALLGCSDEKKATPFEEAKLAFARGDYVAALGPIREAAERGDPEAQNYLGTMFAGGLGGVTRNKLEGYKWFGLAMRNYPPTEGAKVETARQNQGRLAVLMQPNEIAEGDKFVREWKPK